MAQTDAEWMTSSRPYRILAGAVEMRRKGLAQTPRGQQLLALAEQTAQELDADPTLSPYGRFRVRGYRDAMGA